MAESTNLNTKRPRDSDEAASPEASPGKRLRPEDILEILVDDDSDAATAGDLASVMRSFEEEISVPPPPLPPAAGEVDLGFLLEASDDELGLPPASSSDGEAAEVAPPVAGAEVESDLGFGQIWGFEDGIALRYDGLEYPEAAPAAWEDGDGFEAGLFGYGDDLCAPSDLGEVTWRHETMPAV